MFKNGNRNIQIWVYPEKTHDLSQVTDKLNHIMFYRVHLARAGFELKTFVVIGTDCIGSYKSIYYTITITTGPNNCLSIFIKLLVQYGH